MNLEHYTIDTSKSDLFLATPQQIEECEQALNITLEDDYRQYVLRLGNGTLGGSYIRIYLPQRITSTLEQWRNRINQYWFWDQGQEGLTKDQVLQSVRIGDTLDGDEILFYQNVYYVLPIESETIYRMGETLGEVIDWLASSGILTEPFSERIFEPFDPAAWK